MNLFKKDLLEVSVYPGRRDLGLAAAGKISAKISTLLSEQETVNMVFGAAPSQDETLEALVNDTTIEWSRIRAFHMDEYVGLPPYSPALFGSYLREHLFNKVDFKEVFLINGRARNLTQECNRYSELLQNYPTDIVCLGIGENTHIAFNDPHVADFNDPVWVKVVTMDDHCRLQQVNDGCFPDLEAVPKQAVTLTIPALFRARFAYCMVPGERKAQAVHLTLTAPEITALYPASILRQHPAAALFLDYSSASRILAFD